MRRVDGARGRTGERGTNGLDRWERVFAVAVMVLLIVLVIGQIRMKAERNEATMAASLRLQKFLAEADKVPGEIPDVAMQERIRQAGYRLAGK